MELTVRDLLNECIKQIQLGNGNKKIFLATDEEGNGFHPCYFGFTDNNKGDIDAYKKMFCIDCEDTNKVILLG